MFRRHDKLTVFVLMFVLIVGLITLWKTSISSHTEVQQQLPRLEANQASDLPGDPGRNRKELMLHEPEKEHVLKYDTWSTDGAMAHLQRYNQHLNNNSMPITADPKNISTITEWWQAVAMFAWYMRSPLRHHCNISYVGDWGICKEEPYTVKSPCLVYSFGIAYDFSFDDAFGKIGCDVRSFDPSMLNVTNHRRSPNVHFYRYGLSDRNTNSFMPDLDQYVQGRQTWQMRTLKYLVHELGHQGKTIDLLKIDIETSEWEVLDNLIETDMLRYVRLLLIEYHFFPSRPPKLNFVHYFHVMTRLRQLGFREYYNRPHSEFLIPNAYRHQGETFYVNANFREDHKHISWN